MKILDKKTYLAYATEFTGVRMPNGLSGAVVQYRTRDVDGKIFNHYPMLAENINWTNRVLDDSGQMFMPQFLGRVYDYVSLEK